jgi:glycosyltransferase involved in cell wall biosynthesis
MLEGMAGANAIVSTGVGSIPEVIDENRGILVEPGDVDGLTDALATLVTAPERRREMAANNRRAVETEYSWDTVRDELLSIYGTHT